MGQRPARGCSACPPKAISSTCQSLNFSLLFIKHRQQQRVRAELIPELKPEQLCHSQLVLYHLEPWFPLLSNEGSLEAITAGAYLWQIVGVPQSLE